MNFPAWPEDKKLSGKGHYFCSAAKKPKVSRCFFATDGRAVVSKELEFFTSKLEHCWMDRGAGEMLSCELVSARIQAK
jgi:hypothetical protein